MSLFNNPLTNAGVSILGGINQGGSYFGNAATQFGNWAGDVGSNWSENAAGWGDYWGNLPDQIGNWANETAGGAAGGSPGGQIAPLPPEVVAAMQGMWSSLAGASPYTMPTDPSQLVAGLSPQQQQAMASLQGFLPQMNTMLGGGQATVGSLLNPYASNYLSPYMAPMASTSFNALQQALSAQPMQFGTPMSGQQFSTPSFGWSPQTPQISFNPQVATSNQQIAAPNIGFNPQAQMSGLQFGSPGVSAQNVQAPNIGFNPQASMVNWAPQGFNFQTPQVGIAGSNYQLQTPQIGFSPQTSQLGFTPSTPQINFNPSTPQIGFSPTQQQVQYNPGQMNTGASSALGEIMNPSATNPFLEQMAANANNQVIGQFQNQVLPSIRTAAQGAGQYGGTRQGIAEGLALQGLANAMSSNTTNLFGNAYQQAQANRLPAVQAQLGYDTTQGQNALQAALANANLGQSAQELGANLAGQQAGLGMSTQQLAAQLAQAQAGLGSTAQQQALQAATTQGGWGQDTQALMAQLAQAQANLGGQTQQLGLQQAMANAGYGADAAQLAAQLGLQTQQAQAGYNQNAQQQALQAALANAGYGMDAQSLAAQLAQAQASMGLQAGTTNAANALAAGQTNAANSLQAQQMALQQSLANQGAFGSNNQLLAQLAQANAGYGMDAQQMMLQQSLANAGAYNALNPLYAQLAGQQANLGLDTQQLAAQMGTTLGGWDMANQANMLQQSLANQQAQLSTNQLNSSQYNNYLSNLLQGAGLGYNTLGQGMNYNLSSMGQGLNAIPSLIQAPQGAYTNLFNFGTTAQQTGQAGIDASLQAAQYNAMAPYQQLQNLSSMLPNMYPGAYNFQQAAPGMSNLQQALGLAALVGSIF